MLKENAPSSLSSCLKKNRTRKPPGLPYDHKILIILEICYRMPKRYIWGKLFGNMPSQLIWRIVFREM